MSSFVSIFIILCALILRLLVALHPHSGQDNYHGSVTSYGGDYEAQRHWMELTLHLPFKEWYTHDVHYWGLDYPPLTAHVSYICGLLSHWLVGPETVALYTSRYGYMDTPTLLYTDTADMPRPIQYTHKAFMRLTVLVLDVCIFFTAVGVLARRLSTTKTKTTHSSSSPQNHSNRIIFRYILLAALMQPSLILIDHGHFQYNSVSLGLSLWSFYYMTQQTSTFYPCIIASIFFSLALNFKQMTLYYAPSVFFYLLGRCLAPMKRKRQQKQQNHSQQPSHGKDESSSSIKNVDSILHNSTPTYHSLFQPFYRILLLGAAVLFTFWVLWSPFVYYRNPQTTTPLASIQIILKRLFPFQRGMFEGKVANIWCSLSIRPISIRTRIPTQYQPMAALTLTSILILPFCILLLKLGLSWTEEYKYPPNNRQIKDDTLQSLHHLKTLLWGSTGTALAFFLASFQVHEKSILLAMTPASLLIFEFPNFVLWLSLVTMWSMWHLIHLDRLSIAYGTCGILFLVILFPVSRISATITTEEKNVKDIWILFGPFAKLCKRLVHLYFTGCLSLMMLLHVAEIVYTPPTYMPDLFPMIWSVVGCTMFCISWFVVLTCCYHSMNEAIPLCNIIRDKIE